MTGRFLLAEAVQLFDRFLTRLAKRKPRCGAISEITTVRDRFRFTDHEQQRDLYAFGIRWKQKVSFNGQLWRSLIHLLPFVRPAIRGHGLKEKKRWMRSVPYQEAVQAVQLHIWRLINVIARIDRPSVWWSVPCAVILKRDFRWRYRPGGGRCVPGF